MRGYYGIGVYHPKNATNVGTLYRTAVSMGAAFTFVVGPRYPRQASDTMKSWLHCPAFTFTDFEALKRTVFDCEIVAVEINTRAIDIRRFFHLERAVYILGAEDNGLPGSILSQCTRILQLPGSQCHNVATAGAMVIYDRWFKLGT